MSVITRLWNRSSSRESSPSSVAGRRRADSSSQDDSHNKVETIHDDQPLNPYTDVILLQHHKEIVKLLLPIDQYSVASAGCDGSVVIWDIQDGEIQHVLQGHQRPVSSMCVMRHTANDGTECTVLLTAASDKQIIVWDVCTGKELQKLTKHSSTPRCLVSVEDAESGSAMFCSGGDRLYLWSSQCQLLDCIDSGTEEDIQQLLVMKGSKVIAVIDKQIHVYSIHALPSDNRALDSDRVKLRLCKKLTPHREPIGCLVKVNDASFASGSTDGTIKLWSCTNLQSAVREFNAIKEYAGDDKVYPFSVQHMIVIQQRFLVAAIGAGMSVYDTISGSTVAEKHHAHFSKINCLATMHHGYLLASCGEDGRIRLWGTASRPDTKPTCHIARLLGKSPEELCEHESPVSLDLLGEGIAHTGAVQMLADCGDHGFASCGLDGQVILWKDGNREKLERWNYLRDMLHGARITGIV